MMESLALLAILFFAAPAATGQSASMAITPGPLMAGDAIAIPRLLSYPGMSPAAGVPVRRLRSPSSGNAGDGPDILIRDGTIIATAADYEMDGTMWTAFSRLEDSTTYVYRSTDHGLNWDYRRSLRGSGVCDRLGLVVGEGESAFVYLFFLDPGQNGDLQCLRFDRQSDSAWFFNVAVGPDTIRDFAVCRDYSGSNYWLYAVVTNPDTILNNRALRFLRSSSYGCNWVTTDSLAFQMVDPYLAAGAGSYLYFASFGPRQCGGSVNAWINRLWLSAGYWEYQSWPTNNQDVRDPVIGASFTMPESLSTAWCVYSQNYQNSGDWDVMYSYTFGHDNQWSTPACLAGSSTVDEVFPDLRNYTSPGNPYINASYITDDDVYRRVVRRYAHAANPTSWSDTLQLNTGSAGTGSGVRPKLCYTPGGPFTGAGCVFVGAGLNGLWWNAPYPGAIVESGRTRPDIVISVAPDIGRGPFRISGTGPAASASVIDCAGRLVRNLLPSPNTNTVWDGQDASGRSVTPGVYFIRVRESESRHVCKVIVR